jgi:hypothetical protein
MAALAYFPHTAGQNSQAENFSRLVSTTPPACGDFNSTTQPTFEILNTFLFEMPI